MIMRRLTPEDAYRALKENKEIYSVTQVEMTKDPMEVLDMIFGANDLITFDETPQEPESAPQTSGKIDHGKIIALYKAGWSVAKIADEMGCTAQTVRNHIRQEEQNETD